MLSVIAGHTSSTYLSYETGHLFLGMNLAFLLNQAARFSVPLFLLLSGFSLEQTGRQVPYLTFLRTRSARVLPPYLGWVLLYALANTGFDLHTWGGQLGNPPWLLRELLTGQGAPHLYFIPILFQCYLLYPLLRRWVNRAPVQSAAWALMVTFLLQGGYLLHDLELLPFSLPAHLWMLFPTWSFYFVAGMCLQRLDRSHLRVQCKKAALPLLLISAVFACLYCALSHRLSILHAIRPALLAATLLAFFCGIGVWEWLRACPGAGRVVSFFSRHAMGIYYNHVLVIYYLRQFPRFHLGMSGMLLLFAATLCLSTGIAVFLSLVWHRVRRITAQATGPIKAPNASPTLSFSGTTATCTAFVRGNKSTDNVAATVKLWTGGTCLKTWSASGEYSVKIQKTATVSKGKTYKLTVDYTVNGVKQPQKSVTRTCS